MEPHAGCLACPGGRGGPLGVWHMKGFPREPVPKPGAWHRPWGSLASLGSSLGDIQSRAVSLHGASTDAGHQATGAWCYPTAQSPLGSSAGSMGGNGLVGNPAQEEVTGGPLLGQCPPLLAEAAGPGGGWRRLPGAGPEGSSCMFHMRGREIDTLWCWLRQPPGSRPAAPPAQNCRPGQLCSWSRRTEGRGAGKDPEGLERTWGVARSKDRKPLRPPAPPWALGHRPHSPTTELGVSP